MDNTITVSDGTTTHVFGMTSLTAGKSLRGSRQAAIPTPVVATVQQSLKATVRRANIKFSVTYADALGVTRIASRSVADTFDEATVPTAVLTQLANLSKNFLADVNLSAQYMRGEL